VPGPNLRTAAPWLKRARSRPTKKVIGAFPPPPGGGATGFGQLVQATRRRDLTGKDRAGSSIILNSHLESARSEREATQTLLFPGRRPPRRGHLHPYHGRQGANRRYLRVARYAIEDGRRFVTDVL
jgi:hypothetical protein